MNKFTLLKTDTETRARLGTLSTAHGDIPTPIFMPVGTAGTVKGIHQKELTEDIKAKIILGNTYHLYLRPGIEIVQAAGGLHQFANVSLPILTDSGGYQVFSLSEQRKLTEEGALFRSHIDGSKHLFTPENVVDIQRALGSDIMMALDECTSYPCDRKYAEKSLELTHAWLQRGWEHYKKTQPLYGHYQSYFPIVQGSTFDDLRQKSAEFISQFPADGYAIGGLSVGEPHEDMYRMIEVVNEILPEDKPRYLMGVGTPVNLLEGIARGIDMFDCVMPTRNGRNGQLFTKKGIINIKNEKWKNDFSPLDADGISFVDTTYSRAYVRHLIVSGEMLGAQIASQHNLAFYLNLMSEARQHIKNGDFKQWTEKLIPDLSKRL